MSDIEKYPPKLQRSPKFVFDPSVDNILFWEQPQTTEIISEAKYTSLWGRWDPKKNREVFKQVEDFEGYVDSAPSSSTATPTVPPVF